MKTIGRIRLCLTVIAAIILAGSTLLAEKPGPVQGPDVTHDNQHIIWGKNTIGGVALGYYLYVAIGKETDLSKFEKFSKYVLGDIGDSLKESGLAGFHYVSNDNGITWNNFSVFRFGGFQPSDISDTMNGLVPFNRLFAMGGDFSIYMTAYNDDGESNPSVIRNMNFPKNDEILFPPEHFRIHANWTISKDNKADLVLILSWGYFEGIQPDGYKLYMVSSAKPPKDEFFDSAKTELIKTYTTSLKPGEVKTDTIVFTKDVTGINFLTFYMNSYKSQDVSKPTDAFTFQLTEPKHIRIVSHPEINAAVGKPYIYNVKVEAPVLETVEYKLDSQPDGMTINQATGVISWTPASKGIFKAVVTAYLKSDNSISDSQELYIQVHKCNIPATIVGEVVDELGNPVEFGMAAAFDVINGRPNSIGEVYINSRIFNGQLFLPVDEGEYYLYFDGMGGYESIWWENASTFDAAKTVKVKCGDTLYIKVVMKAHLKPNMFTVSGTVVAAKDNTPLQYAVVEFIGKNHSLHKREAFKTFTNHLGQYSIQITDDNTYIARASYINYNSTQQNISRYFSQFYNKTADPTLAEEITLTADKSGVDFALDLVPDYANGISGTVINKDNQPVPDVYVVAYPIETGQYNDPHIYHGHTFKTNDAGEYDITNLIPGKYVLLALPEMETYSPGYYKENDSTVFSWKEGTILEVTETSTTTGITIRLRDLVRRHGSVRLDGTISQKGGVIKTGGDTPLGNATPIAGASVYLIDKNSNVVAETNLSQSNGKFSMQNLAQGKYKLIVDRVGYEPYSQDLEFVDANESQNVVVGLSPDQTLEVTDPKAVNTDLIIYPNPARDYFNFILSNATEKIELSITNLAGLVVLAQEVSSNSNLSIRELPAGVYTIRVIDGTRYLAAKLTVVR